MDGTQTRNKSTSTSLFIFAVYLEPNRIIYGRGPRPASSNRILRSRAEQTLPFSFLFFYPCFDANFSHFFGVFHCSLMMRRTIFTKFSNKNTRKLLAFKTIIKPSLYRAKHHFTIFTPMCFKRPPTSLTTYLNRFDNFISFFPKPFHNLIPQPHITMPRPIDVTHRTIQTTNRNTPHIKGFRRQTLTRPHKPP